MIMSKSINQGCSQADSQIQISQDPTFRELGG